MNLMNLIRRDDNKDSSVDSALQDLQTEMAEAVDESLGKESMTQTGDETESEPVPLKTDVSIPDPGSAAVQLSQSVEAVEGGPDLDRRLTLHAQSRLAALASFDKLYNDAQAHLNEINSKLSEVTTCHHLTRKFFGILDTDVRRTSDLEQTNANLVLEQRKLLERLKEAERARQERASTIEVLHQREATLTQDNEAARAALSAAKMELVEAANTIARNEVGLGDLVKTLSARAVDAERRSRENELLREKQVSLSMDLDKAQKREADLRRKLEDVSVTCADESARSSELQESFAKSEREVQRLQRALEAVQMKQAETEEAKHISETEKDAEIARAHVEMSALRSEIQNLRSRLELAANENGEALSEISRLRFQLGDAATDRQIAGEKLAALAKESDNDKRSILAANSNLSQLSLQQTSDQIQLEIQKQQCEDLSNEIKSLKTRVKELLPYERLYRVAKSRQRELSAGSEASTVTKEVTGKRPTRSVRRKADAPMPSAGLERNSSGPAGQSSTSGG